MRIRKFRGGDISGIIEMCRRLKEWFTSEAIISIKTDLNINNSFVVVEKDKIIGFLSYYSSYAVFHIGWMGVDNRHQRKGIGTLLINKLIEVAKKYGVKSIQVETLAEKEKYEPYELTRRFYKSLGFEKAYTKTPPPNKDWDDLDVMEKMVR